MHRSFVCFGVSFVTLLVVFVVVQMYPIRHQILPRGKHFDEKRAALALDWMKAIGAAGIGILAILFVDLPKSESERVARDLETNVHVSPSMTVSVVRLADVGPRIRRYSVAASVRVENEGFRRLHIPEVWLELWVEFHERSSEGASALLRSNVESFSTIWGKLPSRAVTTTELSEPLVLTGGSGRTLVSRVRVGEISRPNGRACPDGMTDDDVDDRRPAGPEGYRHDEAFDKSFGWIVSLTAEQRQRYDIWFDGVARVEWCDENEEGLCSCSFDDVAPGQRDTQHAWRLSSLFALPILDRELGDPRPDLPDGGAQDAGATP